MSSATLADLLALPDSGQGYELIDGELVQKESSAEHGQAQLKLGATLDPYNRRPGGHHPGGWWFGTEILVDFGATRKFRPDVLGWRRDKAQQRPTGSVVSIIPDWICEILSPGNTSNDTVIKMRAYHQAQVGHYWLLDPTGKTLAVYRWTAAGYLFVLGAEHTERVRAEPFGDLDLFVGALFGDDDEE